MTRLAFVAPVLRIASSASSARLSANVSRRSRTTAALPIGQTAFLPAVTPRATSRFPIAAAPFSSTPTTTTTTTSEMADFVTQPNGLKIKDVQVGTGQEVDASVSGRGVNVHYVLTLNGYSEEGGSKVDSSRDRGSPFSYRYDTKSVIAGWDQGVKGMKVGGKRRLIIPPELGYGSQGAGGGVIPGGATLYFDIELISIN